MSMETKRLPGVIGVTSQQMPRSVPRLHSDKDDVVSDLANEPLPHWESGQQPLPAYS